MNSLDHIGGSWNLQAEASKKKPIRQKNMLKIGVALLIIGALLGTGSGLAFHLLNLKINTITGGVLAGGSGSLMLVDFAIGSYMLYTYHRSQSREVQAEYKVISWNVATGNDYSNLCFMKKKMEEEGKSFSEAFGELQETYYRASADEEAERISLFQETFRQLGNPDIICLQEAGEMDSDYLREILPQGYDLFTSETNMGGRDCTVVWNSKKLKKIGDARLLYDPAETGTAIPNTMVLLKDKTNGVTICVDSAHLQGFSLAEQKSELKKMRAGYGNRQAQYDLTTMDAIDADLYVIAGDFNATWEHYPQRFDSIGGHGYTTDYLYSSPTIYDANLKDEQGMPLPVKLDHIYAKTHRTEALLSTQGTILDVAGLETFNRPSDHLPVAQKIQLTFIRA